MWDIAPRMNVVHHDRKGREIKGYVVAQRTSGANPDPPVISPSNEIDIANVPVVRIGYLPIAGVKSMIENPRKVVPVDDSEN